jgi:hypothetical protein
VGSGNPTPLRPIQALSGKAWAASSVSERFSKVKNRDKIIEDVEALTNDPSLPLSQDDQAAGWTIKAQEATLKLLHEIRKALVEGQPISNLSIGRGLDHWGVDRGQLFEKACALSNSLREMRET